MSDPGPRLAPGGSAWGYAAVPFFAPHQAYSSRPYPLGVVDALDSPHDIVPWQTAPAVSGHVYPVGARSVVVLFQDLGPEGRAA
jgi:hypothetical protein